MKELISYLLNRFELKYAYPEYAA